jgi:hypothetical protein
MYTIDLAYVGRGLHEELVAYIADQQDYYADEGVHVALRTYSANAPRVQAQTSMSRHLPYSGADRVPRGSSLVSMTTSEVSVRCTGQFSAISSSRLR